MGGGAIGLAVGTIIRAAGLAPDDDDGGGSEMRGASGATAVAAAAVIGGTIACAGVSR